MSVKTQDLPEELNFMLTAVVL